MKIQLIRSATLKMEYARRRFLIDPYFAAKHTRPSFTGKSPNPLVDLPCSPQEVIEGAEMVLVSHLHSDHFDPAAQDLLPKGMQIYCQPGDEVCIREKGFTNVSAVQESLDWSEVKITRTPCQHGSGSVLEDMGNASGFIFQATHEPTVYWAGDTILSEGVREVIERFRPQVIITHSCGAVWGDGMLIVMDAAQTVEVCRAAPWSTVVATHMDSLDHATVSREELRRYASACEIHPEQLLIPADGETLVMMKQT